jgi:zinc/manganese transport system substrate-binding protein/manganese/iron transport system substrate-binding protein
VYSILIRPLTFVLLSLSLALLAALAAACGVDDGDTQGEEPRIKAITTLPLFADFVAQIGGERVEVSSLLPPGADPHTYEPVPRDVQRVAEADIAFVNGMDLEPGTVRVIEANLPSTAVLVQLAEEAQAAGAIILKFEGEGHAEDAHTDAGAAENGGEHAAEYPADGGQGAGEHTEEGRDAEAGHAGEDEHVHDEGDPHLWLDVENARRYARIIRDHLIELDPEGRSLFEANYERYLEELHETEAYVREKIETIPEANRKLVTTHDAFGYFGRAYGIKVAGFVSPGPGQDPSPSDIARLAAAIREENVPAVFTEPQIGGESDILEQAAADAGVQACLLYSDSLDDRVSGYVELMRFNAGELARCLGGGDGP